MNIQLPANTVIEMTTTRLPRPNRFFLNKMVALGVVCLVLASCGGREARPISATNPSDSGFDCAGLAREFAANERQIVATLKERSDAQGKNAILAATGVILFPPALFFTDPKSPEKVEIDALRNRNGVLTEIAASKKCRLPASQLGDAYKKLDASSSTKSHKTSRSDH